MRIATSFPDRACPGSYDESVQAASVELPLLDPQVARELRLVAANLRDACGLSEVSATSGVRRELPLARNGGCPRMHVELPEDVLEVRSDRRA